MWDPPPTPFLPFIPDWCDNTKKFRSAEGGQQACRRVEPGIGAIVDITCDLHDSEGIFRGTPRDLTWRRKGRRWERGPAWQSGGTVL